MPGTLKVASAPTVHVDRGVWKPSSPKSSSRESLNGTPNGASSPGRKHKEGNKAAATKTLEGGLSSQMGMEALLAKYLKEPLQWEASQLPSASVKYRAINEEEPAGPVAGPSRLGAGSTSSHAGKASSAASSPSSAQPRPLQKQDKAAASNGKDADLFPGKVPLQFPGGLKRAGSGLHNRGNTCYMNSTMQALLHTPPLAHVLLTRDSDQLKGRFGGSIKGFDPVKALQSLTDRALSANGKSAGGVTAPVEFIKNLRIVARTFHTGRQEDAHEWLRLLLESVQQACLASASPAVKQSALKETTFIQKIFGGRLLSRVTCLSCQHNSDTFDPILDLSLDIRGCDNLGQAMSNFTQIDELRGSEKYKCEKCKRLVVARKQFTLDKCPEVLTVHLKRFTFTGSKLSRAITFPDKFKISPAWTSSKQPGPTYSLYAVVHHHGGGPHSGHYVAEVKSPAGIWCDMNDDFVSPQGRSPGGQSSKSAYMLFYVKDAKSQLEGIVNGAAAGAGTSASASEAVAGSQRERERDTNMSPPLVHKRTKQDLAAQVSSRSPSAIGPSVSRFSLANGPKVNGSAHGLKEAADADVSASVPLKKKLASSTTSSLLTQAVSPASFHGLSTSSSSRALAQDEEEDVGETTTTGAIAADEGEQDSEDADESLRSPSGSQPRTPAPAPLSKKQRRKLERRQKALQDRQQQRSSSSSSSHSHNVSPGGAPAAKHTHTGVIASPYAQSNPIFRNFSPASGSASAGGAGAGAGAGGEKKHLLKRLMSSSASANGSPASSPSSGSGSGSGGGKRQRSNEEDEYDREGARSSASGSTSASANGAGSGSGSGSAAALPTTSFGSASGRKGWMSGMKKKKRER